MQDWLAEYFRKFKFQSVTTAVMKAHFLQYFQTVFKNNTDMLTKLGQIPWDEWLLGQGLPEWTPAKMANLDRSLAVVAEEVAKKWLEGDGSSASADDLKSFSTARQTMFFLDLLINSNKPFASPALVRMDQLYGFSRTSNVEVQVRFLRLCLRHKHRDVMPSVAQFLAKHGRGLYARPLYKDLTDLDRDEAKRVFAANRSFYHQVVVHYCEKVLKL